MPNQKFHNNTLNDYARALRKKQTPQERRLWSQFLRGLDVRFKRQVVFGSYIADFYCSSAAIVIELDGSQHYEEENAQLDRERDDYLRSLGLTVLRYSNYEINTQFEYVCADIYNHIYGEKG